MAQDEIVIQFMSHEMYTAVLNYIESCPNHKENRDKPLRLNAGQIISGNPPAYRGVHIGIESYEFPEAKEHALKAVEGLVKILFSEFSLPEGQRKSKILLPKVK